MPKNSKSFHLTRSLGVICSGGGGIETGATLSGSVSPTWSIDFDPNKPKLSNMVSDFNERNTNTKVIRNLLQEINEKELEKVDIIWGSLPCDRATAMTNVHGKGESSLDAELAHKFCQVVEAIKPHTVLLENVPRWKNFMSFERVISYLSSHFNWVNFDTYLMINYKVPQRRKRLIIRASNTPFRTVPLCGFQTWYSAIEDQIDSLKLIKLQPKVWSTIKHWDIDFSIPFIVENSNVSFDKPKLSDRHDVAVWCLRASAGVDGKGSSRNKSIALWSPKTQSFHALNSRCYARLSGFPDWYVMPDKPGYALYIAGLAVPPLFAQAVFQSCGALR